MIPLNMEESGAITIVRHPNTRVSTSYTISDLDGRVCVNGWNYFMKKEDRLIIGDKVLMLLYPGDHGIYLFVYHVPENNYE